ncbi:ribonuclease P protein component [Chitinophagaceae bacterium IBVUCB1]|nr:ribonuclease P protein component [Chitinophagaceae bacterium IBVUCB1]
MRTTFKAYERLKREQHIDTLFRTGKAFSFSPVRFLYIVVPRADAADAPVMAGFSVPKKKFRKSVHRHRITRLLREAWRLHKHRIYTTLPPDKQIHLFIIYNSTEMPDYKTIEDAVVKGIDFLGMRDKE